MVFAEELQAKFPTVGNLNAAKLLEHKKLPKSAEEEIVKAVYEAADGKTLTEFYRALGVIRPPEEPKYTPPKPLSPEEILEAETQAAKENWSDLAVKQKSFREQLERLDAETRAVVFEETTETIQHLVNFFSGKELEERLDRLVEITTAIRKSQKGMK